MDNIIYALITAVVCGLVYDLIKAAFKRRKIDIKLYNENGLTDLAILMIRSISVITASVCLVILELESESKYSWLLDIIVPMVLISQLCFSAINRRYNVLKNKPDNKTKKKKR